jgi:ELWxxDGT repeat protein
MIRKVPFFECLFAFLLIAVAAEGAGTWTPLPPAPGSIGLMLLLSDGTVMAHNSGTSAAWYRLTPDSAGHYVNGTWSTLQPMNSTRLYYSSQVLKDGRVFVAGGEYGTGYSTAESYNPLTNTWTMAPAIVPTQGISDACSAILPDGRVLVAPVSASPSLSTYIWNPATNTWTTGPSVLGNQNEAVWVKLPDDSILTVDIGSTNSERYIPSLNQWISDATVPVALYDPYGFETGGGFMLPNGKAFFLGSLSHTAIYTPSGTNSPGTWVAGPDIPGPSGTPDAPAVMLRNGKILCAVSPVPTSGNHFPSPTTFYEYDYVSNSFTAVPTPTGGTLNHATYYGTMLCLPDGTALYADFNSQVYSYQHDGVPLAAGKPTITSVTQNVDATFHLVGTQLNGISEGSSYGDDNQNNTNYPIVRLTSGSSVYYARTFNWSRTSVQTGNTPVTTEFSLPAGLPQTPYSLSVIANGIASDAVAFNPFINLTVTLPASAIEGDAPLTGTVTASPAPASDLLVTLASGDTSEATVPATVTILAGQTSATFPVTILDDTLLDGTQNVTITATGPGYFPGTGIIAINDNETATLSVTAPASATEGVGTIQGTVTINAVAGKAVSVGLTSGNPAFLVVPATVTVPAGQTSANFTITIINDVMINGTRPVLMTAHVANWTDGTATTNVLDNENTNLSIAVPATIIEGATGTGTASISGTLPTALVVALSSNTTSRLTVPATVTIPAGGTSATFTLTAPNNALADGDATVTITAGASGFTGTTGTTVVVDNELHHYAFAAIASPQSRGAPFGVTISAKNLSDTTIAGYTTAVPLSATSSDGALSFTPATTGAFTAGVWTGSVTVNTFENAVVLTANDGAGHTGSSNAFDVAVGPVHHFVWSAVANPQTAGAPFSTTITAQDAGNNTATGFAGSASIRAIAPSVDIGAGIGPTAVLPLYTVYHDQRSQCIYLQSEIGSAATITGLALNVTTVPGQTMNNWTIRMKHTALASYTSAAWQSTGWTTVYQKNETISATGLVTFTFTTPFAYDGTSNLMVDFSFNNSSYTSAGAVTYTTVSPARSIHYYTDSGYGDPLLWTGTSSPTPLTSTILPNIKLLMGSGGSVAPGSTGNFTGGVWTGNVVALQGNTLMALQADDYAGHTGNSNTFTVNGGTGPEISVEQPALTALADGVGTIDLGSAAIGGEANAKVFLIRNTGTAALTIAGITGDGPDIARFTFPSLAGTTIPPAGSLPFVVQFTAIAAGGVSAAIHIASDDGDESPFDIALSGTGTTAPEMKVEQPSGTERADGSGTIAFADSALGVPVVQTLTIRNTGGVALNLGGITIDGAHSADFAAGAPGATMIAAGGSTTLDVTFSPTSTGARSAVLHIVSDDPNENPYDLMLTGIGSAPAGLLRIARNINQLAAAPGITATNAAVMGNTLYFAANTADMGTELWKSDGTAAGTVLVKDIQAGTGSSSPANFVVIGSTLYFSANNSTNGAELWRSDGTTAGTVMVKDIFSGTSSSSPANLTNVAGTLYFAATDSTANGIELWKSDGTAAGTVMVLNINAIASTSSSPANLTAVGSRLFFSANDGINGTELWTSDGSAAGTVLVTNINPGNASSSPATFVAVGSTLFFSATDGTNGIELWKSDGAVPAAVLVKDINPGSANSSPTGLVNAGGTLFFRATTVANGNELWKSDGSTAGTVLVKDIVAGTGSSTPSSLVAVGTGIYFAATDGTNGIELWKSDGTTAGTVLVANINPGSSSSSPTNLTLIGSTVYFSATTAAGGTELWKSDGTAATTVLVEDINPGTGSSTPSVMFNVGGLLMFLANDGPNGSELWVSDGTAAGTNFIEDITPGDGSAAPANLRVLNGAVLFNANDGVNGAELWRSDGLPAGTTLLKDIFAGSSSSNPGAGVVVGSVLYFAAGDSAGGTELWSTDGTAAGTVRVKDIFSGTSSSSPTNLARVGATLYFAASDSTANGTELWKSDGTAGGTVLVANINPIANASSSPANLTDFNGTLFFTANDGTNGTELWKSDGTAGGTAMVLDINPASASSSPGNLRVIGNTLYFTATTAANGTELWKTDGTTAGTVIVADLNTGSGSSSPANLTVIGSTLYFSATTPATSTEVWRTDGAAPVLVKDINPGSGGAGPASLVNVNGTLFFSAFDSANGVELWKSDGTTAGTVLVKDITAGTTSTTFGTFASINNMLFFVASTAATGAELWRSDGTAAGTVMVADIRTGPLSSSPANLTAIGTRLFFTATGLDLGTELWSLDFEAPDISIAQPSGTALTDGVSTVTFPNAIVGNGGQQSLTFTIQNIATYAPLAGITISLDGAAAGDYSYSGLSATTLNGGGTATFNVTFAPTATGTRPAALHVASSDPAKSSFDITLTGTGIAPSPLEAWRLANFGTVANTGVAADLADFDGDGIKNIHEWAFATNPSSGVQGPINVNAGVLLAHGGPAVLSMPDGLGGVSYFAVFGRRKDAGAVGLTYTVEFSDALSGWNVSAAAPTVIAQDSEIEAVTVPFPPIVMDPPQAFFRIRVSGQ